MNGANGSFGHTETQKTKRKPKSDIKFQISLNEEQKEAKALILKNKSDGKHKRTHHTDR